MHKIKHSDLAQFILDNVKGATFVSLKTDTQQTALNKGGRKVDPMIESINIDPDKIHKETYINCLISNGGVGYQEFVNNRLLKEAQAKGKDKAQLTFSGGERKWGTHYKGSNALVEHEGAFYLVVYCVANNKPQVEYMYEGQTLDIEDSKFDPWRKPNRREGSNQGTANPIVVRDYKFKNIKQISLLGQTFEVIPD